MKNEKVALFIKAFWTFGLTLELLLIGHYEDWLQFLPLFAIGTSIIVYFSIKKKTFLRGISLVTIAVGLLGIGIHLKNNIDFELEMYPQLNGWNLFVKSMTGALPVMAPGSLIPIGLLGLLVTKLK
ncbi:MAG: hypothetical protein AAGA66_04625 [Bacteroidota bacterium]